jgi:addiction module HigA family antidote
MKKLKNIHPGEILKLDFLEPMNLTPYALAKAIGVDQTRISQLINGSRSMSADTALRPTVRTHLLLNFAPVLARNCFGTRYSNEVK